MSTGTVNAFAQVVRANLTHVDTLTTVARTAGPEAASFVRPMLTQSLDDALGATRALLASSSRNVHATIGAERVASRIGLMRAAVDDGGLPRADHLRFARQFLDWIPGA